MKRAMVVMAVAVVGLLGSARTAAAQTTTPAVPKAELSAGYQFQVFGGDGDSESWPKGWYADIAANLNKTVGLVGLVSGSYKSESVTIVGLPVSISGSAHTFMGGVRFSSRKAKNTAFVQALAGVMRLGASANVPGSSSTSVSESDTAKGVLVGAGVNAVLNRNLSLRIGGDYVRVFPEGDSGYALRATAGLVFAFGSR